MILLLILLLSDLLLEATKFLLLPKLKTISGRILPRKYASSHQVMYAVGGMSRREAMKTAEKYDPKEGKWKPIGKIILSLKVIEIYYHILS